MKRIVISLGIALGLTLSAMAADRHVYLDTDSDGQLNDCPNPAHNAKGASNTDELEECVGGTQEGKVIGTAAGRVSAAACIAGVGVVEALNNGDTADADADGTIETVYGHPQACVYNMGPSDSCEVHSGTYKAAGAQCDEDCTSAVVDQCDRSDCWKANVIAYGYGPNLTGTGYGTQANPGWLRAANNNSSIDSWDPNGDKDPADALYPVILSGDSDADSVLNEPTACAGGVCTGDAFYGIQIGCGDANQGGKVFCDTSLAGGQTHPMVDSDANGTFDAAVGGSGPKEVAWLKVKDIKFQDHNGGPTTCSASGIRTKLGAIDTGGDGGSAGLGLDHIWWTGDVYSALCQPEHYVAVWSDNENSLCSVDSVFQNSLIETNNRFVVNDDCDSENPGASECGCGKILANNRINLLQTSAGKDQAVWRIKSVDTLQGGTRPKIIRSYNNEVVNENPSASSANDVFYNECIGTCDPFSKGLGEVWHYGNLLRHRGSGKWGRLAIGICQSSSPSLRFITFNNTVDTERSDGTAQTVDPICTLPRTIELYGSKNNAYFKAAAVNDEGAASYRVGNNLCSEGGQKFCTQNTGGRAGSSRWWTVGTRGVALHGGVANYVPRTGGPLDQTGSCDPDGDGVAGVDYDGDGDNDTTWLDLGKRLVSCPTLTATIDIGAIQSSSATITEATCDDFLDNDNDGLTDCDDVDCFGGVACAVENNCADGKNNDAAGSTDCGDASACGSAHAQCQEAAGCDRTVADLVLIGTCDRCLDGIDNDEDGRTDCLDTECAASAACREVDKCDDGLDNDNDGLVDCLDVDDCRDEDSCVIGAETAAVTLARSKAAGKFSSPVSFDGAILTTGDLACAAIGLSCDRVWERGEDWTEALDEACNATVDPAKHHIALCYYP